MTKLSPQDAAEMIARTPLRAGKHSVSSGDYCAMELVSYIAGEPWSDNPKCVCPVLSVFVRSWNDRLPDSERDAVIKPFLLRLIGTRGGSALTKRRGAMAADWLVRVCTPAWLRLAKLDAHADALAALPEITSFQAASTNHSLNETVRRATAATAAAVARVGYDVWGVSSPARSACAVAAGGRDWGAVGTAAVAAAAGAPDDALNDTCRMLRQSMGGLLDRMIAAGPQP